MLDRDPSAHVGQQVTLVGVAHNAQSGAMVLLADRTPVYVRGLDEWDRKLHKQRVKVVGTLRDGSVAPQATVNAKGEYSAGIDGDALYVEQATWEAAP